MARSDRFSLRDWGLILGRAFASLGANRLNLIAAGIAFFGMLAIFPAIGAIVALFGLVADPEAVLGQVATLDAFLPPEVVEMISAQLLRVVLAEGNRQGLALALGIGVALWSARAGVAALIDGVSIVHGGAERRAFLAHIGMALFLTGLLVSVVIVALLALIILPTVMAFVDLGPLTALALNLLRWVIAIGAIMVGIGAIYRLGPRKDHRMTEGFLTAGVILATVLWLMGSAAFSVYLANFGNYNEVYGSLGAVVILIMWFYLSGYAVLLGATLDVEIARHRGGGA